MRGGDSGLAANRAPPKRFVAPAACLLLCGSLALGGCARDDTQAEVQRGRGLMVHYQCGSCHVIPEVPAADGREGPSLQAFGSRSYIAGRWPNTPQTLARWIEAPQSLVPDTAMPAMGASADDARAMAAYLGSLR